VGEPTIDDTIAILRGLKEKFEIHHGVRIKDSAIIAAAVLSAPWTILSGEALALLRKMPSASVDAVITDPPYSSGGKFRGDRTAATGDKYVQSSTATERPDFAGDTRDQRSFAYWCALWLSEALRVAKAGAPLAIFTDWRQLPATTDAVQAGGWIWRGVAPWDKTEASRPMMGGFRNQSEFVVWGTAGPTDQAVANEVGVLPGVFRHRVDQEDKFHQTGKPTLLMMDVVKICRPGGLILDPFAGSATTIVAALKTGRRGIGFERSEEYLEIARQRCEGAATGVDWRKPEQRSLFGGAA